MNLTPIIFALLGIGASEPTIAQDKIFHHPPFQIYYSGRDEKLVERLVSALPERLHYIEQALGRKADPKIYIHIALTQEEFERKTRGGAPSWAGGIAYPEHATVVVKAPLFFKQGVPLETLVSHEISHLLIHGAAGEGELPRWFDEGMACVLAGETRQGSLALLSRAAAADRLMGLPRVDNVLGFSARDADLAYAESRSAVQYFVDEFGWETVRKLLELLREDGRFSNAFEEATGVEYISWQVEWLEYAQRRYRSAVWLQIDDLIWVGILLLGTVAVIAVFIRNRRQLTRWRDEEEEAGTPRPTWSSDLSASQPPEFESDTFDEEYLETEDDINDDDNSDREDDDEDDIDSRPIRPS